MSEVSSSELSSASPEPQPRSRKVASDDDDDEEEDNSSPEPIAPPKPAPSKALDDIFSDDEDDDEDVPSNQRNKQKASGAGDELENGEDDEDLGDDLFGDDDDEEMKDADDSRRKVRTLDDEELDSADDLDADPRTGDYGTVPEVRAETSYEVDIGLHPLPKPTDGETYLLKIPQFISIAPSVFQPETFKQPELPPDAAVTPYHFATTAIRWRRSDADPEKLESNSRILRWSDGSLSLQIGSAPDNLYDLPTNPLLPGPREKYDPKLDSFNFLAEPLANSRLVRFFTHATKTMAVIPAADTVIGDDVKHLLAARYKASLKRGITSTVAVNSAGKNVNGKRTVEITYKIEDPEKARREAEQHEKEIERLRKKMEAQKAREADEGYGGGGGGGGGRKSKYRRSGAGALSVEGLEEDGYGGTSRSKEYAPRKRGEGGPSYRKMPREDEYDEDDGFVEADPDSDAEEEEMEDSSEEEEEFEEDRRRRDKKKGKKDKKKKNRRRQEEDSDDEPDAEFTDKEVEEVEAPPKRAKSPEKRRSEEENNDDDEGEISSKVPERKRRRLAIDDSDEE